MPDSTPGRGRLQELETEPAEPSGGQRTAHATAAQRARRTLCGLRHFIQNSIPCFPQIFPKCCPLLTSPDTPWHSGVGWASSLGGQNSAPVATIGNCWQAMSRKGVERATGLEPDSRGRQKRNTSGTESVQSQTEQGVMHGARAADRTQAGQNQNTSARFKRARSVHLLPADLREVVAVWRSLAAKTKAEILRLAREK